MIRRLALVVPVILCLAGSARCAEVPAEVLDILNKAEQLEVLSLHPLPDKEKSKEYFHSYPVLGKAIVKDEKARKALVEALETGAKENKGIAANCFNPRHGLRAKAGDKTVELVICFQCMQVEYVIGDKKKAGFLITKSPEPLFDKVLKDAGAKLAPKDKE